MVRCPKARNTPPHLILTPTSPPHTYIQRAVRNTKQTNKQKQKEKEKQTKTKRAMKQDLGMKISNGL